MKISQNYMKKLLTNLVFSVFLIAISFLVSMLFLDVFVKYPENITQPGTYNVTLFNYKLGNTVAVVNEENYLSFVITKDPIYDFLPFVLTIFLFLISLLIVYGTKKWVGKNLH